MAQQTFLPEYMKKKRPHTQEETAVVWEKRVKISYTDEQEDVFGRMTKTIPNPAFKDKEFEAYFVEAYAGAGKSLTALEGIKRRAKLLPTENTLMVSQSKTDAGKNEEAIKKNLIQNVLSSTFHALGIKTLEPFRKVKVNNSIDATRLNELLQEHEDENTFEGAAGSINNWILRVVSMVKKNYVREHELPSEEVVIDLLKNITSKLVVKEQLLRFMANMVIDVCTKTLFPCAHTDEEFGETSCSCEFYVNYDDMIFLPVYFGLAQPKYDNIIIDEVQDATELQVHFVKKCLKKNGRFFLFGDPNQMIKGFTGITSSTLNNICADLCVEKLYLTESFRCSRAVGEYVQNEFKLKPPFRVLKNASVGSVQDITYTDFFQKVKVTDMVLCRKNRDVMRICLELLERKKPVYIYGKDLREDLKKQIVIVEAMAGANRLSHDASGVDEFERTLQAEKDKVRWQLKDDPDDHSWLHQLNVSAVEDRDRLSKKFDYLSTLQILYAHYKDRESNATKKVALLKKFIADKIIDADRKKLGIFLSTIHRAKGLEEKNVFVLESKDKIDTHRLFHVEATQEERNINLVAATRSKENLFFFKY